MIYWKKYRIEKFIYTIRKNTDLFNVRSVKMCDDWKNLLEKSDEIKKCYIGKINVL